jgi:hypothetical protein
MQHCFKELRVNVFIQAKYHHPLPQTELKILRNSHCNPQ